MLVPISRIKGAHLMRIDNRVSRSGRFLKLFVLGIGLALAQGTPPARADMLFFPDGFAVEGRVKREMKLEFDRVGHDAYYMPDGFFYLDDGPRRIFFSPSQVRYVFEKDPPSEEKIFCKNPLPGQVNPKKFPPLLEVISAPAWNDTWSRRFKFRAQGFDRPVDVPQHIGMLTPYWAQVESMGRYFWGCAYLTRELGPDTVQSLLASHPDFQEKKNKDSTKRASIRLRKADFFAQAGWLDLADKELDRLLTDLPDQKERVEAARKTLWKLRANDRIEEIKRRHLAGQHRRVAKLLEDFSPQGATKEHLAKVEELTHDYKQTEELIKETARLLEKARRVAQGADSALLRDAADVISKELNFENVARLDAFLGQARQEERLQKEGKKAVSSAEQLLSLAVSGWLLGSASAETSSETARRLWHGREMVLTYLRSDDEGKRREILKQHRAGSRTESASLDELVQIIRTLPPSAAEKTLPEGVAEYKTEGATYLVQLPPEYRHTRPYPVLIVLHQAGEKPRAMLNNWKESAAENGYIVVAPEWQGGLNNNYNYSEAEHAVVLNTLRDLRRRFNTDEDRVFLFGAGEGGSMAFDVGLGHPDLFAGVLPMGAGPQYHAEVCWRNAQYLPFYIVHGAQGPDGDKLKDLFKNWVIFRHYPSFWIDYKGRGVEWFGGELPNMFDWMRGKRREFHLRQIGSSGGGGSFGNEFCTQRHGDNHFYWLSCEIDDRYVKSMENWKARLRVPPAALDARIDYQNNTIYVHTQGIRQVTVWLGRNSKGEDMIDFEKTVNVYRNNGLDRPANRKVTPSLDVLLEDFAQRGDRQQLFLAKIVLGGPKSSAPTQRLGAQRRP
jgi:predicted esterase